ncbi:type IV secretory system conjugative DNA transfer family protein, partial [Acidiphilium multivorum]
SLKDIVDETFSGIYKNATQDTAWLSTAAYADLVSGNTFRCAELTLGKATVFINIPLKALDATPAVARVITGALLNAAYEADGAIEGRVLFLLDEAAR